MLHKVLALALGALLVVAGLAWQSYSLWQIKRGAFLDNAALKLTADSADVSGMGLEQVAALHLFGNPAEKPAEPPPPAELPKTDLKLVLVGAITDSDPAKASALIDAEKQVKRYYVGDSIAGGAVLHEVLPASVVLKRDNRYETLEFPKAGDAPGFRAHVADVAGKQMGGTSAPVDTTTAPPAAVGQPQAPKGLSLRDRLQRKPRTNQPKPQGS